MTTSPITTPIESGTEGNIFRIYNVCKSFHRGEQQDRSLTAYVMEFKKIYEELNSLLPISTDVRVMQTQRERIAVMSFLTGLRPEFEAIRSQFLNESMIPSLQETFARVLRNESLQSPQLSVHNNALVSRGGFRGRFRGGYRGGYRGSFRGSYNDRTGDSRVLGSDDVECFHCHELGHTKRTCKKLLAQNQKGPSAHIASASASDDTVTISANEYARLTGSMKPSILTAAFAETGNAAKCLLSSASKWVIDSGASNHMTESFDEEDIW